MTDRNKTRMDEYKFFCDACGQSVSSGSTECPHCHASFSGVRCPSCGHQGRESEFLSGCPSCGFLTAKTPGENRSGSPLAGMDMPAKKQKFQLPDWLFKTFFILLLLIIGGLMFLFGMRFF
ncbi:MAG: hypothetical protein JEY99_08030 [Spirochaetales bacterium]|nr:hypothetical protein [Spirochaetales bacterium]